MSEAPTLLLLPGLDGTGDLVRPLREALPGDIPTHVVQYPCGQTLSLGEQARLVTQHWPAGQVVLCAASCSGLVALTLLAERAQAVLGSIFCAAFAVPPRPYLCQLAPLRALG